MRFRHQSLPRRDVLTRPSARSGETCNLSIRKGDAMPSIGRVKTHWPPRIQM